MNHDTTTAGVLRPTQQPTRAIGSNLTKGKLLVLSYLVLTFTLTHTQLKGTLLDHHNYPSDFQIVDKLYHFVAYFGLTFLVLFCFTKNVKKKSNVVRVESARKMMTWCLFIVIYGFFDELTQPYFGRRFEMLDLLANIVGISLAQAAFVVAEVTGLRRQLMDWK